MAAILKMSFYEEHVAVVSLSGLPHERHVRQEERKKNVDSEDKGNQN